MVLLSSISLLLILQLNSVAMATDSAEFEESPEEAPDGTVLNRMELKSPDLNEEEQHGAHMPDAMRCDACLAISQVISNILETLPDKPNDLALIEAAEKFCSPKSYEGYGVKEIDGVRKLSGPGLESNDVPGVMVSGGRWQVRFATQCAMYLGEVDEEDLYEVYKEGRSKEDIRKFLCFGKGVFSHCSRGTKKDEL